MNYLQIAEESPEIICWAEASEVVLKRNAKTDSVGIKLDTFKSRTGSEIYTLVKFIKPECSIHDRHVLDVGYRIKLINGCDVTRFENSRKIKNLILQSDSKIVRMVVCRPVGAGIGSAAKSADKHCEKCKHSNVGRQSQSSHSNGMSDGLTLNFPSMSSAGSCLDDRATWDRTRIANGFHSSQRGVVDERPPSTLQFVSPSEAESIPLRELSSKSLQRRTDTVSMVETSLSGARSARNGHDVSRGTLEQLAVKFPDKIRYVANTLKLQLTKNRDGRLGFSYKIHPSRTRQHSGDRDEEPVCDYLVDSVTAPPAHGKLQVGDWIRSVNHEPIQQYSDERLKRIIKSGGEVVTLFVQRPQDLSPGLSQTELVNMLASISSKTSKNNTSVMTNGHTEKPGVDTETGDFSETRLSCIYQPRRATTLTRASPKADTRLNPFVKGHRRNQSDTSVIVYQHVFQDRHSPERSEPLQTSPGDSGDGFSTGLLPHALPGSLLPESELESLVSDAFESLASVTLKRAPLVKLLVLSEGEVDSGAQTLLQRMLCQLIECGDAPSSVLSIDSDGRVNERDTRTVRDLVMSGATVNDVIIAAHIARNLCSHHMVMHRLQLVASSLIALPIHIHGVRADLIGRFLANPLTPNSDIVEVVIERIAPTLDTWPAARFVQHGVYFIAFDLDNYLSQPEQLREIQRQLNVIRSYAGRNASVVLVTDRGRNSIEDVTKVAQELDETCCPYRDILCFNSVTDLPLFVREQDDWSGRDFRVLETMIFDLISTQPFVTEGYPLGAVVMQKVVSRCQKTTRLKTMSVSQLQWHLYEMFGDSGALLQRILVALHHSGVLSFAGGVSERVSHNPILDMFVLVDVSVVERCIELLRRPCHLRRDARHQLLQTGFTNHDYLLDRLRVDYMDGAEIVAFLELYNVVFVTEHRRYLLPYHLERWCAGTDAAHLSTHTLYIDFHGFLPAYLGCVIVCGLAGCFDGERVEVHSKNRASFSDHRVEFSIEMFPIRAVCKVLAIFKTAAYKPHAFLSDLRGWIQGIVPPYINWHIGPPCPHPDCASASSEVHVLTLDQSEPVCCGDETFHEDAAVQQWVAPSASVETLTSRKTDTPLTLTTLLGDLPDKLFLLVCDELRVLDHVTHKDWRGLAGKLGKTHKDVMLYNLQPDPCACLLRDWGLTATVQQLLEELDRLGRSDVSGMVREYMETH